MGKYTVHGTERFDQLIDKELGEVATALKNLPENKLWHSLILIGGYGRGEGGVYLEEGKERPFNDYDLILVSHDVSWLKLRRLRKALNEFTEKQCLSVPVDIFVHTQKTLQAGPPSLLQYEMKHGGKVLFGAPDILKQLPPWTPAILSLDEGARLLLNRGALLLYNKFQPDQECFGKYILKAQLALGDALLLAEGKYDVSYEKKQELIKTCHQFPWIQSHYVKAIESKNRMDRDVLNHLQKEMDETLHQYVSFLYWFESRRLGVTIQSSKDHIEALESKSGQETLKSVVLNMLYLKLSALSPNRKWLFLHPRERLVAALPLLLTESKGALLDELLPAQHPLEQFFHLRERFA